MGIRETLNNNARLTTGLAVLAIVAFLAFIWSQFRTPQYKPPTVKVYYSDDDGKTFFEDDLEKIVPFQREGKEAVRAHVFEAGGRAPFVGYLEKYDEEGVRMLKDFFGDEANKNRFYNDRYKLELQHRLVKRPGAPAWTHVVKEAQLAQRIMTFLPQNGQPQPIEKFVAAADATEDQR